MDLIFFTTIDLEKGQIKIKRATPVGEQREIWSVKKESISGDIKNGKDGIITFELVLTDTTLNPSSLIIKITKNKKGFQDFDVTGKFETSVGKVLNIPLL